MAVLIAWLWRLVFRRRTAEQRAAQIAAARRAAVFADVVRIHIAETTPGVKIR